MRQGTGPCPTVMRRVRRSAPNPRPSVLVELARVSCVRHVYPDGTEVSLCGLDFVVHRGESGGDPGAQWGGQEYAAGPPAGLAAPDRGEGDWCSATIPPPVRGYPAADWSTASERGRAAHRADGHGRCRIRGQERRILGRGGALEVRGDSVAARDPAPADKLSRITFRGGKSEKWPWLARWSPSPNCWSLTSLSRGSIPARGLSWSPFSRSFEGAGPAIVVTTHHVDLLPVAGRHRVRSGRRRPHRREGLPRRDVRSERHPQGVSHRASRPHNACSIAFGAGTRTGIAQRSGGRGAQAAGCGRAGERITLTHHPEIGEIQDGPALTAQALL